MIVQGEGNRFVTQRQEPLLAQIIPHIDEEKVREFGEKIYRKKESIDSRMEELREVWEIFERNGLEVTRTPLDGNCFFHAVGQQVEMEHKELRLAAVKYLRDNQRMNGEEWSGFTEEGERGKRYYLRKAEKVGEWVDHILVMATAAALKRKIIIYAQGGTTEVSPEVEEGACVRVGFLREEHYFGAKEKQQWPQQQHQQQQQQQQQQQRQQGQDQDKGEKKDTAVFNLGVRGLTESMEGLLSLGLKFVPVNKVNKARVETDIERLKIRLMWDTYWKWRSDIGVGTEGDEEEEEESQRESEERKRWEARRRKERKFEGKTERVPDGLPQRMKEAIVKYCETVKEDIFKGLRREVKDNLSSEARMAMKVIQEKVRMKEWAVRPADKGGGICVEPYENIVEDGFEELKDETTFGKVDRPGTGSTVRKVETKLKELRDTGVITTKMREFMTAKNTKAGIMKINRKVHKKVGKNGRHPTRV